MIVQNRSTPAYIYVPDPTSHWEAIIAEQVSELDKQLKKAEELEARKVTERQDTNSIYHTNQCQLRALYCSRGQSA